MAAETSPARLVALSHTGLLSGAEAVLVRVLEAAREDGWEVVCLTPRGPLADRLDALGVARRPSPDLKLPAGPRALGALALAARSVAAARTLRREARRADAVLANGILALPALRLARLRVPAAWLVHDVIHRRSWRAVLRAAGGAVTEAVAVSEAAAAPVRAAGIACRVEPHGVEEWPVEPAPAHPPVPPVVGCVALLTPWKGQDVLLEALARLPRTDVELELVGATFPKDGPYAERLRARAAEPDLAGRVRILGQVEDALARMRGWTVGVSASVEPEAGPLTVLEYMSLGVPAVATAHGGPVEFLGDAGLLVPPGDPDALAEALDRLLADDALRARCAEAGPRTIEERRLTGARFRTALVRFLRELVGRS